MDSGPLLGSNHQEERRAGKEVSNIAGATDILRSVVWRTSLLLQMNGIFIKVITWEGEILISTEKLFVINI